MSGGKPVAIHQLFNGARLHVGVPYSDEAHGHRGGSGEACSVPALRGQLLHHGSRGQHRWRRIAVTMPMGNRNQTRRQGNQVSRTGNALGCECSVIATLAQAGGKQSRAVGRLERDCRVASLLAMTVDPDWSSFTQLPWKCRS